jgi:hypothetical protein
MRLRVGVGACPDVADQHVVALRERIDNLHVLVGHHRVHPGHHRAVAVPVGWLSARSVVVVEVGGHIAVDGVQILLAC